MLTLKQNSVFLLLTELLHSPFKLCSPFNFTSLLSFSLPDISPPFLATSLLPPACGVVALHTATQSAVSQEQVENILQENDALRTNLAALEQVTTPAESDGLVSC